MSLEARGQRRCRPSARAELVLGSTISKAKKKKKVTCRLHLLLLKRFKAKKMFTEKHKEIFVEVIKRAPAGHFIKGVLEYLVTSPDQGRAS